MAARSINAVANGAINKSANARRGWHRLKYQQLMAKISVATKLAAAAPALRLSARNHLQHRFIINGAAVKTLALRQRRWRHHLAQRGGGSGINSATASGRIGKQRVDKSWKRYNSWHQ